MSDAVALSRGVTHANEWIAALIDSLLSEQLPLEYVPLVRATDVRDAMQRIVDRLYAFDVASQRRAWLEKAADLPGDLLTEVGQSPPLVLADAEHVAYDAVPLVDLATPLAPRVEAIYGAERDAAEVLRRSIVTYKGLEAQFKAPPDTSLDLPTFRAVVGRWLVELADDDARTDGARRRRSRQRQALLACGLFPVTRPRRFRAPAGRRAAPDVADDPAPPVLHYSHADLSLYVEEGAVGSKVLRGTRLAKPYDTRPNGTLVCPDCGRGTIVQIIDPLVIRLKRHHIPLIQSITDQDPIDVAREFTHEQSYVWLCRSCGRWVVEQVMEFHDSPHWVLQAVGLLGTYDPAPDQVHRTLVDRLAFGGGDLSDLDPAEFERLAAGFLESLLGPCRVDLIGRGSGTPDGGVDLVLVTAEDEYLVQVKHHPQRLRRGVDRVESIDNVRALHGVMFTQGVPKGAFITASDRYSTAVNDMTVTAQRNVAGYDFRLFTRLDVDAWVARDAADAGPPWWPFMTDGPMTPLVFDRLTGRAEARERRTIEEHFALMGVGDGTELGQRGD